jgi:hypothetical protein
MTVAALKRSSPTFSKNKNIGEATLLPQALLLTDWKETA